jgi:hypothetical protein
MRWAAIVLGLAACFDPNAQSGVPCGANDACPGSLVCVNGTCERHGSGDLPDAMVDAEEPDAMPDANPTPMDIDGDGTPNAEDNCPQMFNGDQHDEDDDNVGDVCDNCPHIANASQANAMDGDSVGDACDPNPTLGGDSIARFLPMHVVPGMISTNGTWSQMGDGYVHTNNQDAALVVQGGPWSNPTILIDGTQIANIVPLVWIAATVGETATGYQFCGYEDEMPSGMPDFHRGVWGTGLGTDWEFDDAVDHYNAARLSGAFTIRLHGDAMADEIDCTVNDARGTVNTNTIAAPMLSPGNVGVRSEGISYRINYIVVFTR